MTSLLDQFLRPQSIVLVGVSRDPNHLTARPALYLRQWAPDARVTIVHPEATGDLHGFPTVPSLSGCGPTDVALLLVPASRLEVAVGECVDAGIRGTISIASGFVGRDGQALRSRIQQRVQESHTRLLGPNCVGLVSPASGTPLTFSSVLLKERITKGRVSLVTQSGAIGNAIMLALARRGAGLANWISTGDELDVGAIEAATALVLDQSTAVVGLFLEGVTDPEWLPKLKIAISDTGKRVVVMKAAGSEAGRRAAFGHTGRAVGDSEITQSILTSIGAHLVESLPELADVLTVLSALSPRRVTRTTRGVRTAVVSVSGGMGVIAADAISAAPSLVLADLSATSSALAATSDVAISVTNPLDIGVLGRPEVFPRIIKTMVEAKSIDAVVAVISSLAHDYEMIVSESLSSEKPLILTHLSPGEGFSQEQLTLLATKGVPSISSAKVAIRALEIWAYSQSDGPPCEADKHAGESPCAKRLLPLSESLGRLGIDCSAPAYAVVSTADAALSFFREHGPIVIKADGTTIAHRADVGAVAVGVGSEEEVVRAFRSVSSVCAAKGDRVLVQAMAARGVEVMMSVLRDVEVGRVIVLRPGGTFTELMRGSTVLWGNPEKWSTKDIQDPTIKSLLSGWRGSPVSDCKALIELARGLALNTPESWDVECNPVIVHPEGGGVSVVDILVNQVDLCGTDSLRRDFL